MGERRTERRLAQWPDGDRLRGAECANVVDRGAAAAAAQTVTPLQRHHRTGKGDGRSGRGRNLSARAEPSRGCDCDCDCVASLSSPRRPRPSRRVPSGPVRGPTVPSPTCRHNANGAPADQRSECRCTRRSLACRSPSLNSRLQVLVAVFRLPRCDQHAQSERPRGGQKTKKKQKPKPKQKESARQRSTAPLHSTPLQSSALHGQRVRSQCGLSAECCGADRRLGCSAEPKGRGR